MKNPKLFYSVIIGLIVIFAGMVFYSEQEKKSEEQKILDDFDPNREQIVSSIEQLIVSGKYQDAIDSINTYSDKYSKFINDDIFDQLKMKVERKKEKTNKVERTNKILSILTNEKPTLQGWCFGKSLESFSYDEEKNFFDQSQWVNYYKDLYADLIKLNPGNEEFIKMEKEFYQKQNAFYQQQIDQNEKKRRNYKKEREKEPVVAQKSREELTEKFGNIPDTSIWGLHGYEGPVMEYLKKRAHNPPSVSIIGCSKPGYTSDGWLLFCEYRGQNAFGAMIHVDWHGLIPKKCHDIVPGKNEVEPGSSQLPGSV